jgi:hypothetical protein
MDQLLITQEEEEHYFATFSTQSSLVAAGKEYLGGK